MQRFLIVLLFSTYALLGSAALPDEYSGNRMLEILGESRYSEAYDKFKTKYLLDKALKNPENGIKLTAGHDELGLVTAVTLTASGFEINDIKYKQFSTVLPFNISFDDNEASLTAKLGEGKGSADDFKLKYKKDGVTISVYFKSEAKKKITHVKYSQSIGYESAPYRVDEDHSAPRPMIVVPTPMIKESDKSAIRKPEKSRAVAALPSGAVFTKPAKTATISHKSPFYNAVMSVIESGEEEMFRDIKKEAAPTANFWNYKYTYRTSVSIPGEKYNVLYSFPFEKSQLDFVSVIDESIGSSASMQTKYDEIEALLKQDFTGSEGWSYHYSINQEDAKGMKDLEIKNSKLGSIILDHSINPQGKHVLYMRFLLQYK
jgi:hypothetical protein